MVLFFKAGLESVLALTVWGILQSSTENLRVGVISNPLLSKR